MFSSLSREDFSLSRAKHALPVFMLLWLGALVLALVFLLGVRDHLRSSEKIQTSQMLDSYLAANRFSASPPALFLHHDSRLHGLLFVRFRRGDEEMLVLGEEGSGGGFREFLDLPPDSSTVWLQLDLAGKTRILSVVSRTLESGLVIQGGKDAGEGYRLYRSLCRFTVTLLLGSIVIFWPLSLIFIRLSLAPLVSARQRISEIGAERQSGAGHALLPETGNGQELDQLYTQINRILSQNRHLVTEIQQSLDNVAHDLRTPMTRLRSVAEYGIQSDDPEKLREALADCLEESERVLAMLRIMMSVAEAESGTMRLERTVTALAPLLEHVVTLYEYVAEEKQIELRYSPENEEIRAYVDETRISQVLANLMDNAIKYGREGGWVAVALSRQDGMALIRFSDNGIGISAAEQGRIWERLYRGDRSRSQKGLGLGLNYVKAVVEAHGGTVTVQSSLHQGSCFEVALPAAAPYLADSVESTQEKSQTSGE